MKPMTQAQIDQIKSLTEDFLENNGCIVQHSGLLKKIKAAGAIVDENNQRVKIPKELLRELLSKVPESYWIADLDGNKYEIGGDNQYTLAIVTDPWIVDYDTGKPRRPCLEDVRKHTIIGQTLDHVVSMSRMDFPVTDYKDSTSSLRALEIHLLNQNKHISIYPGSFENYKEWLDIVQILTKGRDAAKSNLFTVAVAVVSPLVLGHWNAELLLDACKNNFKIVPTICPMAGTTSPYSKDATLLQGNVENIFLAALTQMVNPGNPFLYAFGPSVSDMRSGHDLYYTLDKVLWKIATTELAISYGMPTSAECGGTLTHRYDMQSGAESMIFMLTALNPGADIISGVGSCYNANGLSSEMIVIQS